MRATARTVLAAHWREMLGREITSIDDIEQPPQSEEAVSDAPQRRGTGPTAGELSSDSAAAILARKLDQGIRGRARGERRQRQGAPISRAATRRPVERGERAKNARGLRRYVDDLLRGRRPRPFQPDDFEARRSEPRSSCEWRVPTATHRVRNSLRSCMTVLPSSSLIRLRPSDRSLVRRAGRWLSAHQPRGRRRGGRPDKPSG